MNDKELQSLNDLCKEKTEEILPVMSEAIEKSKFPPITNGNCDGGGCGRGYVCFCNEYQAMKEEFQRVFDKAWDTRHPSEGKDIDCVNWEKAWRFGSSRYDTAWEEMVTRTRGSCVITMKE